MSNPSIAVFGSSGLVGSSLCQRLYFQYGPCFRALIHTFASAARISRFPIEIRQVNLQDYAQVLKAIADCECVVNCVKGDQAAMVPGLKNMIRAAQESRIRKFIHLGSIAIYGEDPPPGSDSEDAEPTPTTEYGRIKQHQDQMISELHQHHVPAIILCPGHITGPHSNFISQAMERLSEGKFVLVDGGRHPTNHIHVDNLVEAILTAIEGNRGWGEKYFVTETERPTWAQLYSDLRDILGLQYDFGDVGRDDVTRHLNRTTRPTLFSNARKLLTSVMRRSTRALFDSLGPELQDRVRTHWKRPTTIQPGHPAADLSGRFIAVQVRRPYFAPRKIQRYLGYKPILSYREGMDTIERWYNYPTSFRPTFVDLSMPTH